MDETSKIPEKLERWLTAATAGLVPDAEANCRIELSVHFNEAVESFEPTLAKRERISMAIASLGDAAAVNRHLQRQHLTQKDIQQISSIFKADMDPHTRHIGDFWSLCFAASIVRPLDQIIDDRPFLVLLCAFVAYLVSRFAFRKLYLFLLRRRPKTYVLFFGLYNLFLSVLCGAMISMLLTFWTMMASSDRSGSDFPLILPVVIAILFYFSAGRYVKAWWKLRRVDPSEILQNLSLPIDYGFNSKNKID